MNSQVRGLFKRQKEEAREKPPFKILDRFSVDCPGKIATGNVRVFIGFFPFFFFFFRPAHPLDAFLLRCEIRDREKREHRKHRETPRSLRRSVRAETTLPNRLGRMDGEGIAKPPVSIQPVQNASTYLYFTLLYVCIRDGRVEKVSVRGSREDSRLARTTVVFGSPGIACGARARRIDSGTTRRGTLPSSRLVTAQNAPLPAAVFHANLASYFYSKI